MRTYPNPTPTTWLCKIKRVYPRLPLHVHSTARQAVTETPSGYPPVRPASREGVDWSGDSLRQRLEAGLTAVARRLESIAQRLGDIVDDLLRVVATEAA